MALLKELISVDEAIRRIVSSFRLDLRTTYVNIEDSLGLISAEDVVAPYDIPPCNKSVVDGYALRAKDTYGASPSNPVELKVIGEVDVNVDPEEVPSLKPFTAVKVATGSPLPKGSDAVIMYEDVERLNDKILVYKPLPQWANVARVGEDFRRGDLIVSKGTVLGPWHIASLASYGFSKVLVYERIKVVVIPIGSEVIKPNIPKPLRKGVYDSTSYLIKSFLSIKGYFNVSRLDPIPDDLSIIRSIISKALESFDIVITCGGTSVGERDLTYSAIKDLGDFTPLFRGVAIRPGRPVSAALVGGKLVFMVSGFPVAALATLDSILMPSIKLVLGVKEIDEPVVKAKLVKRLVNVVGYTSYFRVKVFRCGSELCVEPLRLTGSGILSTLIRGNGVVIIPPNVEGYDVGTYVKVKLIGPIL